MEQIKLKLPGEDDYFVQEALKVLRTNIQFCGQDIKVIMFTSCNENEGKSTVSLGVAKSLAEQGKNVLVIDADMRKSVMAGKFSDVKNAVGLSEVLNGMINVGKGIYQTQYPRLHVLFSGKYPPNPVELLGGKYFSALVDQARITFDYVIIDTPPLGAVVDAAVVAQSVDGAILVLGGNKARYRQAQEALEMLNRSGKPVLGAVLNNRKQKGNTYYYRKKYYGR